MSNVTVLISKLKEFEIHPETEKFVIEYEEDNKEKWFNESTDEYHDKASPEFKQLVQEIMILCDSELIDKVGQNNDANMNILRNAGFRITNGESDSFGPLTMVIYFRNFKMCYG